MVRPTVEEQLAAIDAKKAELLDKAKAKLLTEDTRLIEQSKALVARKDKIDVKLDEIHARRDEIAEEIDKLEGGSDVTAES